MTVDWEALRRAAEQARDNAHAPYSHYAVGAALLDLDGRVHVGCNVENASYGLTLCAERSAHAAAVVAGARGFVALAVVAAGERPPSPCGACRQVLCELGGAFEVRCYGDGEALVTTSDALLPDRFGFTPPRE